MSIASQTSRVNYVGNGNVDEYDFTFKIFSATDLRVTVRNENDAEELLVLDTDYTVSGVNDENGGTITLVDGNLDSGHVLTIRRVRDLTQETDIRNQGEFFPETHEDTFDHLVMVDQQQQDEIDRCMKVPETVSSDDFDPELPSNIGTLAGQVLMVNQAGDGWDFSSEALDGQVAPEIQGDLSFLTAGSGPICLTPNGLHTWRISISNEGDITREQIT